MCQKGLQTIARNVLHAISFYGCNRAYQNHILSTRSLDPVILITVVWYLRPRQVSHPRSRSHTAGHCSPCAFTHVLTCRISSRPPTPAKLRPVTKAAGAGNEGLRLV